MGRKVLQLAVFDDAVRWTNKIIDPDFKIYLLNAEGFNDGRVVANKKRREKDEDDDNGSYDDDENDPQFEHFLEKMKEDDKSYIVEGVENGSPLFIKYEGESSSDKECDVVEPGGKLRSMTNQRIEASNRILCLENRHKSEKVKNVKLSTKKRAWECDYHSWIQNIEVVGGDCYVYKFGGRTVVYEVNGTYSDMKDEDDDVGILGSTFDKKEKRNLLMIGLEDGENNPEDEGCSSDVEILESGFNKTNGVLATKDNAKFRKTVIAALQKPYNQKEYEMLLQEVELRRPEERHLDLRHGRERSYSVKKEGKSYLDHYPEVGTKLAQFRDDKRSRLNLLRGFFVWLKQPGRLCPWKDEECLAIKPGSEPGSGLKTKNVRF